MRSGFADVTVARCIGSQVPLLNLELVFVDGFQQLVTGGDVLGTEDIRPNSEDA